MLWLMLLSVVFFGLWKTLKFALFCVAASVLLAVGLMLLVLVAGAA